MSKQWQPCPLCGNCKSYQRSDEVAQTEAFCKADCKPDYVLVDDKRVPAGTGCWMCKGFRPRGKIKSKKIRKIKPWQAR